MISIRNIVVIIIANLSIILVLLGCGSGSDPLAPNQRPQASATARPPESADSLTYVVQFTFTSIDPDGIVSHHLYAIDPPEQGDTTWVRTSQNQLTLIFPATMPEDPLPSEGPVTSTDYHVFVFKAVDDRGFSSLAAFLAFTSFTIAPQTQIVSPAANIVLYHGIPESLAFGWKGIDPDGVFEKDPVLYRYRLVDLKTIQSDLNLGSLTPSAADVQRFFSQDSPTFADWDSVSEESTVVHVRTQGFLNHYFAVSAVDEAGAYESRFIRGKNVLRIWSGYYAAAPPVISVFNAFFHSQQNTGGIDLDVRRVIRLEVPANGIVEFNWFAEPRAIGSVVTSYRWVFDPLNGDIYDETPRQYENQFNRWSVWSLNETHSALGPFSVPPDNQLFLRLYVQARDNYGSISMVVIELRPIVATFDKPLLVFDDFEGPPDRLPDLQPFGSFPTEAVLDTLLHAVGNKPYQFRPSGTVSDPGVFAGFDYDTLDYRFFPFAGLPLSVLAHYEAVVWFTGEKDAGRRGGKFTSRDPMSGLRFINTVSELNTLSVYLLEGGKAWLFGDGIVPATANGFASRFGQGDAQFPYAMEGDAPGAQSILWPGNFLYDFLHARSEIRNISENSAAAEKLKDLVPYLPEFRTPGAPWPPGNWTGVRGGMDDPRVGPSSERNQGRWSGLPMLTLTNEFSNWPGSFPSVLSGIAYVSQPNQILEDDDNNPATPKVSRLDTLYLMRAEAYNPSAGPQNPDGKPVFFYYWGEDHGPVVWTSVPLWFFDRTQLQTVAERVLGEFGIVKNSNPSTWQGPGSVNEKLPRLVEAE